MELLKRSKYNYELTQRLLNSGLKRILAKKYSNGSETDESLIKKLEIEMDKSSLLLIQVRYLVEQITFRTL
jgi:hypothetical protein